MKVKSVMTAPAEIIGGDESVETAARKLRDANVGLRPVLDHGQIVGVVTDRDLIVRVLAEHRDPNRPACAMS